MTPKPKPANESKRKKLLERVIEAKIRDIIQWRDGNECVMKARGGGKCHGFLCINHYIPRNLSAFLKYDLGNVFWGCQNHNLLDHLGHPCMSSWFAFTFGEDCVKAMDKAQIDNVHSRRSVANLWDMLEHYKKLYENRYIVHGFEEMVRGGYYGEIIRNVFWRD